MRLGDIYQTAIRMGIAADPRGKAGVDQALALAKRRYEQLPDYLQEVFDQEELSNPYVDTRIYHGDPGTEVTSLIAGVDMNVGEVLLTDRLREKGEHIDAIYTHHPEGAALTKLDRVMDMQADIWEGLGVPINVGQSLMDERRKEVRWRFMPMNADQAIDAARLLDIPFVGAHTPTDNLVVDFLNTYLAEREPLLIEDVRKALFEIPEYKEAARRGAGPHISDGTGSKRAGKVWVDMTGGTEGPAPIIEKLADHGVGTVVQMHMGPELRKEAEKHHINVVIAGHISSDSLGINLFMDELERQGVRVIPTSGYIRVRRDKDRKLVDA